jgi:peptidoglycan/LPS O-acetylase OafA/YrhL
VIGFRADIEGLRAVAVLLVVFDHLDVPGFQAGFIGVDVFFVISGYLISGACSAGGRGKTSEPGCSARRTGPHLNFAPN